MIKTCFILQVFLVDPAPKWRTQRETSALSKALQWTFQALTTLTDPSDLYCGPVMNSSFCITHGRVETSGIKMDVFLSLTNIKNVPLWESETWQRATQLCTSSVWNHLIQLGDIVVTLESLWLSQVLMNWRLSSNIMSDYHLCVYSTTLTSNCCIVTSAHNSTMMLSNTLSSAGSGDQNSLPVSALHWTEVSHQLQTSSSSVLRLVHWWKSDPYETIFYL